MPIHRTIDTLPRAPRRIVSLVPSLTETVAELGATALLAGVTTWCWHPAEAVKELPKVGGTKNPDLPRIRALEPDLVIANEEENRKPDIEALAESIDCWVTFPKEVADNAGLIRDIGDLVDREQEAAGFLGRLDDLESALAEKVAIRPRRSVAYLIWRDPYMAVNQDTYIHRVLDFLGLDNPWAEAPDRYPAVAPEAITAADPDFVCLASEPFPFTIKHVEEFKAQFPDLRVVQEQRVFIDDGTYYCWYGTRWVRALDYFLNDAPYWD